MRSPDRVWGVLTAMIKLDKQETARNWPQDQPHQRLNAQTSRAGGCSHALSAGASSGRLNR